jgi:putative intracellular protease/amidase
VSFIHSTSLITIVAKKHCSLHRFVGCSVREFERHIYCGCVLLYITLHTNHAFPTNYPGNRKPRLPGAILRLSLSSLRSFKFSQVATLYSIHKPTKIYNFHQTMPSTKILSLLAALPLTALAAQGPPFQNTTAVPRHYAILAAHSVTSIDMFGPLDVFTALAMYYVNETGPMQLSVVTANDTPATTSPPAKGVDFGVNLMSSITVDHYLEMASKNFSMDHAASCNKTEMGGAPPLTPIDVLLIPGGGGMRGNVDKEVEFVKKVYPSLKYLITVCTGSTVAARAGVLDGKKATTNKKSWKWATSFGNNVDYISHARWVRDGNIYTGSGVSAAVDTTYQFISDVYGEPVAQWIADASEYTRWGNASHDPFADRWGAGTNETKA